MRGKFRGDAYEGTISPIFQYRPFGITAIAEISSPDEDDKTVAADLIANDFISPGLVGTLSYLNGRKGELSVGAIYRHIKFGGVTGRVGIPFVGPQYFLTTLQIQNPDTNGVGVGGSARILAGEEFLVDSWKALVTYNTLLWNGFFGAEQKVDQKVVGVVNEESNSEKVAVIPTNSLYIVGGIMKRFETDKIFAINGAYNTTRDTTSVDFLFKKTFEDLSYYKIKAGVDGKISSARLFNVSHGNIVLGANADVFTKTGSLTLNVVTNF